MSSWKWVDTVTAHEVRVIRQAGLNRLPFFYGWVIVAISTVAGAFTTGIIVWGLGIFITPMQDELGWSRTTLFLPLAIGGIASSMVAPPIGPYADRKHGPRVLFMLGVLITGTSVMYLREVSSTTGYLLVFGLFGGLGRYLIQIVMNVIPKWFVRKRGLAQATNIAGMIGGGPLVFPLLLQTLVASIGWRDTWFLMGLGLLVIGIPASLLIVRQPEDIGLHPDGDKPSEGPADSKTDIGTRYASLEVSITRRQAVRTKQFWLVVFGVSIALMAIRGLIPNFVPFFVDRGIDPAIAAGTVSAYSIGAMVAAFGWGRIVDRKGARKPYIAACLLVATATTLMLAPTTALVAYMLMVYFGVVLAGFWVIQTLIVANTFGREHIGAIRGIMQPFNNAAMFGGPVLFGAIYDLSGNYAWLFLLTSVMFLISAGSAGLLKPLNSRTMSRSEPTVPTDPTTGTGRR